MIDGGSHPCRALPRVSACARDIVIVPASRLTRIKSSMTRLSDAITGAMAAVIVGCQAPGRELGSGGALCPRCAGRSSEIEAGVGRLDITALPATREAEAPRRALGDFADRVGIGERVETAQVDGIVLDCPAGSATSEPHRGEMTKDPL